MRRQIKVLFTVFVAMLLGIQPVAVVKSEAKRNYTVKKALKAYKVLMLHGNVQEDRYFSDYEGELQFSIQDMNNDGIPELLLEGLDAMYGLANCASVFTYHNDALVHLGDSGHSGWFEYYKNSNVIKATEYAMGNTHEQYLIMENGTTERIASKEMIMGFNEDTGEDTYDITYYLKDKKVSEKEYTEALKKYNVTDKAVQYKTYEFTKENVLTYCK